MATNALTSYDYYSLANLTPSDDGRFIAIAEDFMSRRIHEIRILDTDSDGSCPRYSPKRPPTSPGPLTASTCLSQTGSETRSRQIRCGTN